MRRYGDDLVHCVRAMMAVDARHRWTVDDVLAFVAARHPPPPTPEIKHSGDRAASRTPTVSHHPLHRGPRSGCP